MSTDSKIIEAALDFAASSCRYHGTDFGFLGWESWGPPRCDSCKEPWAVRRARGALAALVQELDRRSASAEANRPVGDLIAASSVGAGLERQIRAKVAAELRAALIAGERPPWAAVGNADRAASVAEWAARIAEGGDTNG